MNEYFDWIQHKIGYAQSGNYISLLRAMMNKPFYVLVPRDDNRESEGKELRTGFNVEPGPCSVLEMMVAVAGRISEDIYPGYPTWEDNSGYWFWLMVENLGLDLQDDARFNPEETDYILDRMVNREYDFDGNGGLFPRKKAEKDQREVEIWYQIHGYLMENYEV